MREAAATQSVGADFGERVDRRIEIHRRRRQLGRGAAAATAAIVALAAVSTGMGPSGSGVDVTPADEAPSGWYSLGSAPIAWRYQHLALDMGGKVLLWGGRTVPGGDIRRAASESLSDGAIYDGSTDHWQEIARSPLAGPHAMGVWTGSEAILWSSDEQGHQAAAAYDPATDRWRSLPDPPVGDINVPDRQMVWTGSEALILGTTGDDPEGEIAVYEPATDSWRRGSPPPRPLNSGDAVWTGKEMIYVGQPSTLMAYAPLTDSWRDLRGPVPGAGGGDLTVAWTGTHLFVGGGDTPEAGLYDPRLDAWEALPDAPVPFVGNGGYRELWTGTHVLTLNDGGDYAPVRDSAGRPVAFDPAERTWHVGARSETAARRTATPWVWDGRAALVPTGGLQLSDPGLVTCCLPMEEGQGYRLPDSDKAGEFTLASGQDWKVVAFQRDGHDCVELRSGPVARTSSGTCDFSGQRPEWATGTVDGALFIFGAMPADLDAIDLTTSDGQHQRVGPIPGTVAGTKIPVFVARIPEATALATISAVRVDGTTVPLDPGPLIPPSDHESSPSTPPGE